jgi:hypothetical protein
MALTSLQSKLIGAAGTGIGGLVGSAIATKKSPEDVYNQERIAELKRQQELGTLGLTEAEKTSLENKYAFKLGQIGQEGSQRRAQQMASFDVGGGQALLQAAMQDKAIAEAQMQADAAIAQQDALRRRELESELLNRQAMEQKRFEKKTGAFGKVAAETLTALSTIPSETIEEKGQLEKEKVDAVVKKFGISESEAKAVATAMQKDPEIAKLLLGAI